MRKCRNWQTSKTKDLVSIALVWVQVPSSAFIIRKGLSFIWKFFFVSISIIPQYIIIHEKDNKKRKKLKESKKFCRIIIMRIFKMYNSDEIIEEVRSRNDIVDVISTYVKLQKKGSSNFGMCPFHYE